MARRFLGFFAAFALFILAACDDPEPIRIGFIGGLTGRSADIGEASRNAVQLAVQEVNAAGGVDGRPVELLVRDDANDPAVAGEAVRDLHAEGVAAIIGPNISAIAGGMVPVLNELEVVTISPTVSSLAFAALDDYFFRINSTTRQNAQAYAEHYAELGYRRIAAAIDDNNRIFSESWLQEFTDSFETIGGELVGFEVFDSTKNDSYAQTASALIEMNAEALMLIANSVDTAQLAQQIRKLNADILLIAAEWAASERLIALGGATIEGLELVQSYNRDDGSERYVAFREAYRSQFQQEPGYASLAAYDAATVLFRALAQSGSADNLKQVLLNLGEVQGLQQMVAFDRYGDAQRRAFFVAVRDGKFVLK